MPEQVLGESNTLAYSKMGSEVANVAQTTGNFAKEFECKTDNLAMVDVIQSINQRLTF